MTAMHTAPFVRRPDVGGTSAHGASRWVVDGPTHESVLLPAITRRQAFRAAALIGLVIVLIVAVLILVATLASPRPKNSHPGDAQPPPVGYVVPAAAAGGLDQILARFADVAEMNR